MAVINRQFYQTWRGPGVNDQDSWLLVFNEETRRLQVRHEWGSSGYQGFDDYEIVEFLQQSGTAQTALIDQLFLVPVEA